MLHLTPAARMFSACVRSGKTERQMGVSPHDLTVQKGWSGERNGRAVLGSTLETMALTLVLKDFPIQLNLQLEFVLG